MGTVERRIGNRWTGDFLLTFQWARSTLSRTAQITESVIDLARQPLAF